MAAEAVAPSLFLPMGPSEAAAKTKNSPEASSAQPIKSISNILNPKALSNATDIDSHNGVAVHGNMSVTRGSNLRQTSFCATKSREYGKTTKRARTASESSNQKARMGCKKPKVVHVEVKHREGGPIGLSKLATAARNARAAEERGEFKVNAVKMGNWKKKILLLDHNAEFDETQIRIVRHSICGRNVKVKEPYDTTRFSYHIDKECANLKPKPSAGTPTLFKMFGISTVKRGIVGINHNNLKTSTPPADVERKPCPGIMKTNNERIPVYLGRTGTLGGGGRSVTVIAMEKFKKAFKLLTSCQKREVLTAQVHEHQWRNDHENLRVFSTSCSHEVKSSDPVGLNNVPPCGPCSSLLSNNNFKSALSVPVPLNKHYIHINYWFRNRHLGHLYARTKGLKILIEAEVPLLSSYAISILLNFDRTLNLPPVFVTLKECCPGSLPAMMSLQALLRLWF